MLNIDPGSEFGARVLRRLRDEQIIWLTTVRADGTPQPSPVWFYWHEEGMLIYSQPNTPKLRNIGANPTVALHFNSDADGGDIVVLTGAARIDQPVPSEVAAAYIDKYREGIQSLNSTPESFARSYSVAIIVTPTAVRGF